MSRIAMRRGSKAKSTRMLVPSGLSSFMFECREPSTVSARGLGNVGPRSSSFSTARTTSSCASSPSPSNHSSNSSVYSTSHGIAVIITRGLYVYNPLANDPWLAPGSGVQGLGEVAEELRPYPEGRTGAEGIGQDRRGRVILRAYSNAARQDRAWLRASSH